MSRDSSRFRRPLRQRDPDRQLTLPPRITPSAPPTLSPGTNSSRHSNNLSLSSSSVATARKSTRSYAEVLSCAFPLVEFGMPPYLRTPSFKEEVMPRDAGERFLKSRAGAALMAENAAYIKTVHQYAIRACRLHGRRLLVLGAGSSNAMMPLIARGPAHVSFVDTSQVALDRLTASIKRFGLETASVIECHKIDANEFVALPTNASMKYDVVLCTKALGQILSTGPGLDALFENLLEHLAPGADVLMDQHDLYTSGGTIGDVATPADREMATIGGRFADDACYDLSVPRPGYDKVAKFSSSKRTGQPQVWTLFHYRTAVEAASVSQLVLAEPPTFVNPVPSPAPSHDPVGDAAVPINARGAKAILSISDKRKYSPGLLYPKVDGVPGVLHLVTGAMVFISSLYRCAYPVDVHADSEYECSAEIVTLGDECVFVVNGLISLNGVDSDPLSVESLKVLESSLAPFSHYGVLVSAPKMLRHVKNDRLTISTPKGPTTLPLDGVHVSDGKQNGLFYKPAHQCTVDAMGDDVAALINDATDSARSPRARIEKGPPRTVSEYSFDGSSWTPIRQRHDKTRSDKPGSVVHTVLAAAASLEAGVTTVERLCSYLRD